MTRSLCVLPAALMLALACAFSAPAAGKGPVDLRSMSRTMAFAAVYDMQVNPATYVGRLVRMNGSFATFEVRPGEKKGTACIIKDAAACCAAGLEFSLAEKPKKLPREDSAIAVEGVFTVEKKPAWSSPSSKTRASCRDNRRTAPYSAGPFVLY